MGARRASWGAIACVQATVPRRQRDKSKGTRSIVTLFDADSGVGGECCTNRGDSSKHCDSKKVLRIELKRVGEQAFLSPPVKKRTTGTYGGMATVCERSV